MAINWTDAQINEIVQNVLAQMKNTPAQPAANWDATQYNGRKLIGIF